jgi:hypothetical protein
VGVINMMTRALSKEFVALAAAKKATMFALEDIAVALWIERLQKDGVPVTMHSERRFYRQRICEERAFNVLLERGPPLYVDPAATMYIINPFRRVVWCGVVWCGVVWCGGVSFAVSFSSVFYFYFWLGRHNSTTTQLHSSTTT